MPEVVAEMYEVTTSWWAPHPKLPKRPDGSLPLVFHATRPTRRSTKLDAYAAAEAGVRAVPHESMDAVDIEAHVALIRFDVGSEAPRERWRRHVATVTPDGIAEVNP